MSHAAFCYANVLSHAAPQQQGVATRKMKHYSMICIAVATSQSQTGQLCVQGEAHAASSNALLTIPPVAQC